MEKKKLQINICFAYNKFRISQKLIKEVFTHILKKEKISSNCIIDIAFVNNTEITKLNKKYRGKNKPTDVLSFSMIDDDEIVGACHGVPLLGEIIISVPYAKSQIKKVRTGRDLSLHDEIIFLLIHGLLHLLGYDDETVKGYNTMMKKQNKHLKQLKSNYQTNNKQLIL